MCRGRQARAAVKELLRIFRQDVYKRQHEQRSIEEFDKINDALFEDSYRAHAYASVLGPIIGNIGKMCIRDRCRKYLHALRTIGTGRAAGSHAG